MWAQNILGPSQRKASMPREKGQQSLAASERAPKLLPMTDGARWEGKNLDPVLTPSPTCAWCRGGEKGIRRKQWGSAGAQPCRRWRSWFLRWTAWTTAASCTSSASSARFQVRFALLILRFPRLPWRNNWVANLWLLGTHFIYPIRRGIAESGGLRMWMGTGQNLILTYFVLRGNRDWILGRPVELDSSLVRQDEKSL